MPSKGPDFDVSKAHRYFAVEFNNLAWDLVEGIDRSDDAIERMIHAAHAALGHWNAVGTDLNRQRAYCLLSTAYAIAKRATEAVRYAEATLRLSEKNGSDLTLFEVATAHGCAAKAFGLAGETKQAEEHGALAYETAKRFDSSEERDLFDRLYASS